ncbi:MAG: efflux RND transporter periplasmic adaptor subunit, partial [Bacteroidota bacterium]
YNVSKSNYERLTEAAKTAGAVSAYDIDVALAKRNADYAQLQTAKASIREITDTKNYLLLKAPFSGVVTARNVSAGAYVGPSGRGSEQPLFTLQEHKKLRLAVAVPEAYVAYLHKAGIVKFRVKSLPEAQFTAQISRLAGALDTRLRAQRVEFDIPNENGKLLPGMIAEVSFTFAGTDNSLVVPKTALINSSEHLAVIRVAEGKARLVDVRTGRIAHDSVEIFGPLSEGDQLVKAAAEEIRDGSEVTIAKAGSK